MNFTKLIMHIFYLKTLFLNKSTCLFKCLYLHEAKKIYERVRKGKISFFVKFKIGKDREEDSASVFCWLRHKINVV